MTPQRYLSVCTMLLLVWATTVFHVEASAASNQTTRLWRLAAQEQAALDQRGVVLHDASLSRYLQTVAQGLWAKAPTELSEPTIKVVMDPRMQAYIYPNGYCFISTGILSRIENEDQLAMILAHEMVHYLRQHTAALHNHFQMSFKTIDLAYANQNEAAGELAVKQQIGVAEYQADDEGLAILMAAGYCEAEVLSLMSNLRSSLQDQGSTEAVEQMKNRIKTMKAIIERVQGNFSCTSASDGKRADFLNRIAPALIANAQAAITCGDWNQADQSISKFLVLKPEDARAHYFKGEILRRGTHGNGKIQCIGSYVKALKIDPDFPLAHRALGELHFKAGRFKTAKPYFEAFLSLAPQDDTSEFVKGYLRQCPN